MGSFVISLARVGDPRITTSTVAGRAAWHYDGPTIQDRNGGEGAPNHAVADVDQASGVLLHLQRRVDGKVTTEFTASDATTGDRIDRSRYQLDPPAGAKKQESSRGFVPRSLDQAAAELPYDLLVPEHVPDGFTLGWSPGSVSVNREVASPSGPEGANPPSKPVTSMTWRLGAQELTITLRPTDGATEWNDPLGAEGMVPDAQPVRIELPGRPALEGTVVVDGPLTPQLWGITGDIVVEPPATCPGTSSSGWPRRSGRTDLWPLISDPPVAGPFAAIGRSCTDPGESLLWSSEFANGRRGWGVG